MNSKERSYKIAYEMLTILAMIALLSFICRLWPIIILTLVGIIIAAMRMLFLKFKSEEQTETQVSEESQNVQPKEPKLSDVYDLAFALIPERISTLVSSEYENAKWVWETPDARKRIENGEDVFILLNEAGGYRRAKVQITALRVVGIHYLAMPEPKSERASDMEAEPEDDSPEDDSTSEEEAKPPANYELIAFEWADAHMMEINARCNEAIGQKQESLTLTPEELPANESWEHIRSELIRAELSDVECTDNGIIIYLNRKQNLTNEEKGNEEYGVTGYEPV